MKWIYVVTWTVVVSSLWFHSEKYTDDYGIERINSGDTYRITDSVEYSKRFDIREEAIKFVENAPTSHPDFGLQQTYVSRIKLDSIRAIENIKYWQEGKRDDKH